MRITSQVSRQGALLLVLCAYAAVSAIVLNLLCWCCAGKAFVAEQQSKDQRSSSHPAAAPANVHGLINQFRPKVTLEGGFVEGEKVTATITFPDLPEDHAPVSMRFVTQWQREDVGKYWLTHGEAMARAKLRQRGHYEAVGEQAFFIPTIDSEPLAVKRFLPIEGEEVSPEGNLCKKSVVNTLQYECCRHDIGCRLRFVCQPVDLCGHVGRVIQAVTPHILCPFPRVRSAYIRDVQTGLVIATKIMREAAESMRPCAEMLNAPVKSHTLHLVADYIGGDEGECIVKWYRIIPVNPKIRDSGSECMIAEQVRPHAARTHGLSAGRLA